MPRSDVSEHQRVSVYFTRGRFKTPASNSPKYRRRGPSPTPSAGYRTNTDFSPPPRPRKLVRTPKFPRQVIAIKIRRSRNFDQSRPTTPYMERDYSPDYVPGVPPEKLFNQWTDFDEIKCVRKHLASSFFIFKPKIQIFLGSLKKKYRYN